jgi:hypothetical protein
MKKLRYLQLIEDLENLTQSLEKTFKKVSKVPDLLNSARTQNELAKTIASLKLKIFEVLGGSQSFLFNDLICRIAEIYIEIIEPNLKPEKLEEVRSEFKSRLETLELFYKRRVSNQIKNQNLAITQDLAVTQKKLSED